MARSKDEVLAKWRDGVGKLSPEERRNLYVKRADRKPRRTSLQKVRDDIAGQLKRMAPQERKTALAIWHSVMETFEADYRKTLAFHGGLFFNPNKFLLRYLRRVRASWKKLK